MRVLVIGIDGATFRLMRPLMQNGYMPFLCEVEQRGALGTLETIYPPVTAPAWSSFMTGKNPGKHGVYEFLHRKRGTLEQIPVNAGMLGSQTLWEMMSNAGKRMVVVSVPLCYPPFPVNGTLMSDFLAPKGARDLSYPPELLQEVEDKFGEYLLYHKQVYTKDNVANVLAELEENTEYRQRVAEYLLQRDPWDFAMVYFEGTDRLQHELWHVIDPTSPMHDKQEAAQYAERTRNYYRVLDNDVRKLVELAQAQDPDTQVILMSDHGFGAIHKFVNFNIWLLREGFLKLKQDIPTQLKHALFNLGFTPSLGYKLSMNFGFANLRLSQGMTNRNQILDLVRRGFLSFRNVDWAKTRAFSSGNYGQIFVNLQGRHTTACRRTNFRAWWNKSARVFWNCATRKRDRRWFPKCTNSPTCSGANLLTTHPTWCSRSRKITKRSARWNLRRTKSSNPRSAIRATIAWTVSSACWATTSSKISNSKTPTSWTSRRRFCI
jgi:predicted AlkP superfamily phosphohydrolase/phosphomutase